MMAIDTATWGVAAGAAFVAAALLILLIPAFAGRAPRSRALAGGGRFASADRRLGHIGNRVEALGDRLLHRLAKGEALGEKLEKAGLDLRPGELLVVVACASLVTGLAGGFLVSRVFGLLAVLATVGVAWLVLGFLEWRRKEKFAAQLGDTLQMLAATLRAGYGVGQAVDAVAREAESPTAEEFRRCTVEVRLGRELADAFHALARRVESLDFEWVVQAFEINQDVGGDLAELLDAVCATIRDRNRVRRQVQALSAEGRMSAGVLYVLPFTMAGVMTLINPGYLNALTASRGGYALLATGGTLMLVGGIWLRRIVKPNF